MASHLKHWEAVRWSPHDVQEGQHLLLLLPLALAPGLLLGLGLDGGLGLLLGEVLGHVLVGGRQLGERVVGERWRDGIVGGERSQGMVMKSLGRLDPHPVGGLLLRMARGGLRHQSVFIGR